MALQESPFRIPELHIRWTSEGMSCDGDTVSVTAATAEAIGGQGIVAVFAAGVAYNRLLTGTERRQEWEVQEAVNRDLVLPVFTLLGVVVPWEDWKARGWRGVAFVIAGLLLRRLPLIFSLPTSPSRLMEGSRLRRLVRPIGVAALLSRPRRGPRSPRPALVDRGNARGRRPHGRPRHYRHAGPGGA